jgi:sec-independent protein translocase protein TatA
MFGNAFGWPHLVIIVLVVLVLFGASKLPVFAKGLGQSIKIFKREMDDIKTDDRKPAERDRVTVPVDETNPDLQARRAPDER